MTAKSLDQHILQINQIYVSIHITVKQLNSLINQKLKSVETHPMANFLPPQLLEQIQEMAILFR